MCAGVREHFFEPLIFVLENGGWFVHFGREAMRFVIFIFCFVAVVVCSILPTKAVLAAASAVYRNPKPQGQSLPHLGRL